MTMKRLKTFLKPANLNIKWERVERHWTYKGDSRIETIIK